MADGGRVPVHRTEVRLDQLLREACSAYANRAEAAGVSIELEAAEERIGVDAARVRQAVDNVIGNALGHTPSGGRMRIVAVREGGSVRVVFDDTGAGFPPDFIGRAFEPFARAASERADTPDGAGLGLAIVRAVARPTAGTRRPRTVPKAGRGSRSS